MAKVMICDDAAFMRMMIKDILTKNGYEIAAEAENGQKAVEKYPEANISPVDYDPGASEANQTNRIKLLMTVAKDNLKTKQNAKKAIDSENQKEEKSENKISN